MISTAQYQKILNDLDDAVVGQIKSTIRHICLQSVGVIYDNFWLHQKLSEIEAFLYTQKSNRTISEYLVRRHDRPELGCTSFFIQVVLGFSRIHEFTIDVVNGIGSFGTNPQPIKPPEPEYLPPPPETEVKFDELLSQVFRD